MSSSAARGGTVRLRGVRAERLQMPCTHDTPNDGIIVAHVTPPNKVRA